ncbi:DNA repair protein complementing XP-C cells homolog [Ischnura elegans]|uniref:DNA repair protein complementing XP-C cells homolog n=1 Tax=Ischnura elegans TaxID=197161 RepID=UPI001ED8AED6|nr:DNA repair protein complementing XP-C cells homolog [Ischnura elegans]
MRRSKRVIENGLSTKREVSSCAETSASEIVSKRKRLSAKNITKASLVSEESQSRENMGDEEADKPPLGVMDGYESSDSSSNEFEKPDLSRIEMEELKIKEEYDFAAIEDNILADVGRLSESEDSDFEDVLPAALQSKERDSEINVEPAESKVKLETPVKAEVDNDGKRRRGQKLTTKEGKRPRTAKDVTKKKSGGRSSSRAKATEKSESTEKPTVDVTKMDVTQLLALGERFAESCKGPSVVDMDEMEASTESESDEEGDWEEVTGDADVKKDEKPHVIPKEGVQITLDAPELFYRRKKKGIDLEACLKRRLNRTKRGIQVLIHKVHLLCWIAHGRWLNSILNSQNLMGVALSLLPSNHCYPPSRTDLDYLEKVVNWFRKAVPVVVPKESPPNIPLETSLEVQFHERKARSVKDQVLMFVCAMRSLGIKARLVLSLQPAPLKPPSHELCSIAPRKSTDGKTGPSAKSSSGTGTTVAEEGPSTSKTVSKKTPKSEGKGNVPGRKSDEKKRITSDKPLPKAAPSDKNSEKGKSSSSRPGEKAGASTKSRSCKNKKVNRYSDSSESEEEVESKTKRGQKNRPSKGKSVKGSDTAAKSGKGRKNPSEGDSDFEPEVLTVKKTKGITVKEKDRKVLSSSSENEGKSGAVKSRKRDGVDVWAEVFLEMEEKWISVDVPNGKVHCVVELHAKATSPVLYILAFGNDLCLKDVTRRYCPQWLSVTQKKRVDERWWNRAIAPFKPPRNAFDRREEEEMDEELESRPLPSSINEYKNHPLYALKRHLLKFEAIYPPDAPTLGFIRGEPVYSRDCVHQLHSRETWIKEAKLVRLGEKPYKIVKARPKYDRMSGKVITDLPLELFGPWQVDDYIPPPAVDGKVPRNEYGNVDLYKTCMLPAGTVHLRLPGLNRVAKKLQIDCAPAVVGFDFHSGGSHPTFDGFIVCEEFKEIVIDAWNQEQEEQEKRQREKREKRVYGNWVRLVRGLLIRESLKNKYSFGEVGESSSGGKKKKSTGKKS